MESIIYSVYVPDWFYFERDDESFRVLNFLNDINS